jgi:hypothetical protein
MFTSPGQAAFLLSLYLGAGGIIGGIIGSAVAALSRGRFRLRHLLIAIALGVAGAGLGGLLLFALPTDAKLNGVAAELLGPEPRWADLLALSGAAVVSLAGSLLILARGRREARA